MQIIRIWAAADVAELDLAGAQSGGSFTCAGVRPVKPLGLSWFSSFNMASAAALAAGTTLAVP